MTEYGRGPGSEPWHPEDPLYGDGGWGGQAADGQPPYGGQPQHYPQQPQQQQAQYGDWSDGQQGGYGQQQFDAAGQQHQGPQHPGPQHPGQQYPGQQPYHGQGQQHYGGQGQQQYGGQYPGHDQQQYADPGQQQYQGQDQQQYHDGGWDNGTQHQVAYAADPTDPYANQAAAYGGQQPDFYNTPDAYPPPEPPARRRAEPEPAPTDWDPGPDQGEHAFFAEGDDDDDSDDDDPKDGRGARKGRGGKGGTTKKRRSGCACLVVVLVFGGGVGGVGYFGYQFYQKRFGPAPDYVGGGTGEVTVNIPKGAGGFAIAQALKQAGVIKSVDAFVSAQQTNPDGTKIQAGAYLLKKEMSAASAVKLMLDPKSQNNVVVVPGERNILVYKKIDEKLSLPDGTTAKVAKKEYKTFGLPSWANNNKDIKEPLEGFLYPATYPAAKGMKPEAVLKQMVTQAVENYKKLNLEAKAKEFDLADPLQLVTVASMVQAEGKTHDDFRKMAEVIYNRLKSTNTQTNRLLQFDSTFNYLKGQSKIHISESEINRNKDPYNTYTNSGLPPGPIGNPGDDAFKAALNPTDDGWLYFVATDGQNNTEFAKTYAEFQRLKDKFNESSGH
ncbi:endolytic transglycosylase MltG [Streptomyces kaempferi]|uniref:Endolytic murein transglycosylase n=1 Tax=Streptomyces kaempferi TaxID=333725 RepID=A0ABW3XKL4_9ACTN